MAAESDNPAGASGEHPPRLSLPILVAPSLEEERVNTLAPPLAPMACWRMEDFHFEFDSSIIKPQIKPELAKLAGLWERTGRGPLSVFGHADPVGDDEYNKTLSGRRATATYALLTRDVELWDQLYAQPFSTDHWQQGALPMMRGITGQPASTERKQVFRAYMDAICQRESAESFIVEKTGFIARGSDPGGKGDYQGCSEFNPILLFSQQESRELEQNKPERNRQNQPNRRVMIFLFAPGLFVDPAKWPCPRAKEAGSGCRPQFWPDGDRRRAFGERRRKYETDRNTFACGFYDAMARRSPCEILRKQLRIRLFDGAKQPTRNAQYRVTVPGTNEERLGRTDGDGWFTEPDLLAPGRVLVEWAHEDEKNSDGAMALPFRVHYTLAVDESATDDDSFLRRLSNLGYSVTDELESSVDPFQRDYGLTRSGQLDEPTRRALIEAHDHGRSRDEINGGNT